MSLKAHIITWTLVLKLLYGTVYLKLFLKNDLVQFQQGYTNVCKQQQQKNISETTTTNNNQKIVRPLKINITTPS